jgi:hypothetical protein
VHQKQLVVIRAGVEQATYRYYKPSTRGLDFEGLMSDIQAAPAGSVFLLHACAHNPTGVDPTTEQWKQISKLMLEKGHFPAFDMAYQVGPAQQTPSVVCREPSIGVRGDFPACCCHTCHRALPVATVTEMRRQSASSWQVGGGTGAHVRTGGIQEPRHC